MSWGAAWSLRVPAARMDAARVLRVQCACVVRACCASMHAWCVSLLAACFAWMLRVHAYIQCVRAYCVGYLLCVAEFWGSPKLEHVVYAWCILPCRVGCCWWFPYSSSEKLGGVGRVQLDKAAGFRRHRNLRGIYNILWYFGRCCVGAVGCRRSVAGCRVVSKFAGILCAASHSGRAAQACARLWRSFDNLRQALRGRVCRCLPKTVATCTLKLLAAGSRTLRVELSPRSALCSLLRLWEFGI